MPVSLARHFQRLAVHSTHAHERVFAACAQLTDAERRQGPAGADIHAVLDYGLNVDRVWIGRLKGIDMRADGLDTITWPDWDRLWQARAREDSALEAITAGLDPEFLAVDLAYIDHRGIGRIDPVVTILAHLFDAQATRRGRVCQQLALLGQEVPDLHLLRILNP